MKVGGPGEVQHSDADGGAAQQPDEIGVKAKQGHHQRQSDDPGKHEEFQRREARGGERVDLLGDLHGSEPGREGGAGAARHDDGCHHRAHLTHHGDADQIGDVDLPAELLELDRSDEGENDAHQEADQRDDRQGLRAALLDQEKQVRSPVARLHAQEPCEGDCHFAQKGQHLHGGAGRGDGGVADAFEQQRLGRLLARAFSFRHRLREIEEPADA